MKKSFFLFLLIMRYLRFFLKKMRLGVSWYNCFFIPLHYVEESMYRNGELIWQKKQV